MARLNFIMNLTDGGEEMMMLPPPDPGEDADADFYPGDYTFLEDEESILRHAVATAGGSKNMQITEPSVAAWL